jgi:nitrate ABC transporter ATP-binding subunit
MSSYVELFEVAKAYPGPRGGTRVVSDFNLTMQKGEVIALIGHSGCGKSTVLSMIAGLNPLTSGVIIVAGREVKEPGPDRAVVFQAPCLLPWLTALENVRLGVDRLFEKEPPERRKQRATEALQKVGLGDALDRRPAELSGGMQQRVGIARALSLEPKILLLDEPFGMLDSLTRMELQEILLDIVERQRTTALMVTHDVDEALFVADRVVMMTSGPDARVGRVLDVGFERPRKRSTVDEDLRYYELREELISFLEEQEPEGTGKTPEKSADAA